MKTNELDREEQQTVQAYQKAVADHYRAKLKAESLPKLEADIERVADEYDRETQRYEGLLNELNDQCHGIKRKLESTEQALRRALYPLPMDPEERDRLEALRSQLQAARKHAGDSHAAWMAEQRQYQLTEQDVTAPNRRPRPDDAAVLADARAQLRTASKLASAAKADVARLADEIEQLYQMNANLFTQGSENDTKYPARSAHD